MTGSEALWAEHGLTGLVLFALFVIMILGIRYMQKKDRMFEEELKASRAERIKTGEQNYHANTRLSTAVEGLTREISNHWRSDGRDTQSNQRKLHPSDHGLAQQRDQDRVEQKAI